MKYITIVFAFFCTISATNVYAADSAYWGFHGLVLGSNEKSVLERFPDFSCKDDGPIRRCQSNFKFSKEGDTALPFGGSTDVFLVFANDKLENIHVIWFPTLFDSSYSKLKAAYGTPLEEKSAEVRTQDGRTLENKTITWHNGTSTIRYERFWQNIGMSRILFSLK